MLIFFCKFIEFIFWNAWNSILYNFPRLHLRTHISNANWITLNAHWELNVFMFCVALFNLFGETKLFLEEESRMKDLSDTMREKIISDSLQWKEKKHGNFDLSKTGNDLCVNYPIALNWIHELDVRIDSIWAIAIISVGFDFAILFYCMIQDKISVQYSFSFSFCAGWACRSVAYSKINTICFGSTISIM